MTSLGETIAGSVFSTTFTYDSYGRPGTRTHPSGIVETFGFNSYGYLSTISAGGSIRYTLTGMNARDQLTGATFGSSLSASYGFDSYGYPSSTSAGTLQDYRYSFDPVTGNLNSRQNYKRSLSESFLYDNLERLTTVTGPQNLAMTYSANGNIQTKSDINSSTAFTYGTNAGPYALTGVTSSTGVIPTIPQTAAYTSFEKVDTIAEAPYVAKFKYNSDNQRARMVVTQSGSTILTRWYVGSRYMKETASGVTKEFTYLGGDAYSAPVVAVTQSGTTTYYYLLRDYLGNITHQVNTSNAVVAEYNFDAWGRRRSADDWSYTLDANDLNLVADRGFTGHEFLKYFNLYNMNGRMYDPLVGRFLNVDPYVQMPDFSQNYNRYTYCLNNPLKFTDPSGYRLAGPEYDSSIDAVNAYLGYMTDVTGAWHLPSGGGGGSSGGTSGYYFSCGNYYDRKSGVVVKWNEVYDNYVVPYSSLFVVFHSPSTPSEDSKQKDQNYPVGIDSWELFYNIQEAESYLQENEKCRKEKFMYFLHDQWVLVGPWNDASIKHVSPRWVNGYSKGSIYVYGNGGLYDVDFFVHTHFYSNQPSQIDKDNGEYYYWPYGVRTLIYYERRYYEFDQKEWGKEFSIGH